MGKFEIEYAVVESILAKGKENLTHYDRMQLLSIFQVPYHDTGKIETMYSCDSSCNNCTFCKKIRENGKDNDLLICNYCYDNEQEKRWKNVENRHGLQLRIISSVDYKQDELATLDINFICRFNSSGDIENVTHARNYLKIAFSHPETFFGLFAKNTPPVIQATDELGKPKNCKYVQSSPIIGKPVKLAKYFDFTFTVYPDEKTLQEALKNGAMECNGQKCKDCKYKCYKPSGWKKGSNIAELLRIRGKDKQEKILKAFYQDRG